MYAKVFRSQECTAAYCHNQKTISILQKKFSEENYKKKHLKNVQFRFETAHFFIVSIGVF